LHHFWRLSVTGWSKRATLKGKTWQLEYRWAEGRFDLLPALAADLVSRKVDLILASGGIPSARAAKDATSKIPVVFTAVSDPVGRGLIVSLARPGGNLTGFSIMAIELMPKRFQLISELVPQTTVMALLWNPTGEITEGMVKDMREMAREKGVQLHALKATTEIEIDPAFASLDQLHAGALIVGDDPFFTGRREQIVGLVSRHGVPAIYQFRDFVVSGGLISYGVSLTSAYRQAAMLAGKILKGAKPADLPVEQPAKLELVVNLKAAKALGLTMPPTILARADEVIE
jgi:putative ABC transport system substrate-binding protein